MNDLLEAKSPANANELERWLGRREAFGMIAGRCSAADVECLRQIRKRKLYLAEAPNWNEFCTNNLKSSRRKIDTDIRLIEKHGPPIFHLMQITRITAADCPVIAPHVTADGLMLDGEVIALLPENAGRLAEAVSRLLEAAKPSTAKEDARFDTLVKRCESVNALLEGTPGGLNAQQKVDLASALCRTNELAARLGVLVFQG